MQDDTLRYIEHLQRKLSTPGMEPMYDHARFRRIMLEDDGQREARRAASLSLGEHLSDEVFEQYARGIREFVPKTAYDTFTSNAIFAPIVSEVEQALHDMGRKLAHPVRMLTSPDASPSPASQPSTDEHYLFIGEGTSRFCNYWGKVFSQCLADASFDAQGRRIAADDMKPFFEKHPSIAANAIELALHYAFFGNLLHYGVLQQSPEHFGFRMELVHAMEVFIVGHEYGHFLLQEYRDALPDQPDEDVRHADEHWCDGVGLEVCRHWGARAGSWFAFSGAAPLIFFRATSMCENARSRLNADSARLDMNDSHPPTALRLEFLRGLIPTRIHPDQTDSVTGYCGEVEVVGDALEQVVAGAIRLAGGDNPVDEEPGAQV
ncbi:hypothetical protein AB3662_12195 [Sorangium cellulosum]|uniref:hypothetical protein n=1 Tax=Sorangium cellulosum TaxID=56 RepID=UPI003D9A1744